MKRLSVFAVVLVSGGLASCVTAEIEAFTTPDGRPAFNVFCGGTQLTMTDCYESARTQCGGDFSVLAQSETQRGVGQGQSRRMEFVCANP